MQQNIGMKNLRWKKIHRCEKLKINDWPVERARSLKQETLTWLEMSQENCFNVNVDCKPAALKTNPPMRCKQGHIFGKQQKTRSYFRRLKLKRVWQNFKWKQGQNKSSPVCCVGSSTEKSPTMQPHKGQRRGVTWILCSLDGIQRGATEKVIYIKVPTFILSIRPQHPVWITSVTVDHQWTQHQAPIFISAKLTAEWRRLRQQGKSDGNDSPYMCIHAYTPPTNRCIQSERVFIGESAPLEWSSVCLCTSYTQYTQYTQYVCVCMCDTNLDWLSGCMLITIVNCEKNTWDVDRILSISPLLHMEERWKSKVLMRRGEGRKGD